jgi:hypothetical protein
MTLHKRWSHGVANWQSSTQQGAFELVVRDGMSLRIPADFDETTLARLVSLLGRT